MKKIILLPVIAALLLTTALLTAACGGKKQELPPIQAEARNIGIYMDIEGDERVTRPIINIIKKTIEQLYYTDAIITPVIRAREIEEIDVQTYYRLCELLVDDMVIVRGQAKRLSDGDVGFIGSIQLWNLAMGKELFKENLKLKDNESQEGIGESLRFAVTKAFALNFSEPGLYPRSDFEKSGDLFFARKEFNYALEMYKKAFEKLDPSSRFAFNERHKLREKMSLTEQEIRKRGETEDASMSIFKEEFKFVNIPASLQKVFVDAYNSTGLRAELRAVTNRPVSIIAQNSEVGREGHYKYYSGLSMHITIRFDGVRYLKAVAKEPKEIDGYKTLSINPYAKIMFQTLAYRDQLLSLMNEEERGVFKSMPFYIHLTKAIGDEVAFKVVRNRSGMPAAPTSLIMNIQEYENHEIASADASRTLGSGYFLINPESMPAAVTLLLDFFGIDRKKW